MGHCSILLFLKTLSNQREAVHLLLALACFGVGILKYPTETEPESENSVNTEKTRCTVNQSIIYNYVCIFCATYGSLTNSHG